MTYILHTRPIQWKTTNPVPSTATEGEFVIIADQGSNITNLLPVGTKFYFSPATTGDIEDPRITRTITAASYAGNENTFRFTPKPAISWSALAWVVLDLGAETVAPRPDYTCLSQSLIPTAEQLAAAVAQFNL